MTCNMARAAPAIQRGEQGMGCLGHVGPHMPPERRTVGTAADKTKGQKKLVQTA